NTRVLTNFNYTDPITDPNSPFTVGNPISTSTITLNGYQVGEIFTGSDTNYVNTFRNSNTPSDGINVYSFSFDPEIHQPTGTANLGVINTSNLNIKFVTDIRANDIVGTFRIYGLAYNILRFM